MADEHSILGGNDSSDLSLTAIINALNSGAPMSDMSNSGSLAAFNPNATINYTQAGVPFPELPLAGEGLDAPLPGSPGSRGRSGLHGEAPEQPPRGASPGRWTQTADNDDLLSSDPAAVDEDGDPTPTGAKGPKGVLRKPREPRPPRPERAPREPRPPKQSTATRKTSTPRGGDFSRSVSQYRPINIHKSTYRIRGGGGFRLKMPIALAIAAVLALGALGLSWYGFQAVQDMIAAKPANNAITLTTAQTRAALDARLPVLMEFAHYGTEDMGAALGQREQFFVTNARYRPDSPDASAAGTELIAAPNPLTEEQLQGFYEGGYNAYSPEELQQYFNGAFVLDMAVGDMGYWKKLKYVNLNATSINDEMAHVAEQQQLTGETVSVVAQGLDSHGNHVIQGTKAIGEQIYYFKIAACSFAEVYTTSRLGGTNVYVTCTVATYDFYTGADTITPA